MPFKITQAFRLQKDQRVGKLIVYRRRRNIWSIQIECIFQRILYIQFPIQNVCVCYGSREEDRQHNSIMAGEGGKRNNIRKNTIDINFLVDSIVKFAFRGKRKFYIFTENKRKTGKTYILKSFAHFYQFFSS
jgi:hypothetical protein